MKTGYTRMLILALIPLIGLGQNSSTNGIDPEIAEAVFRYQFQHNDSGVKTNACAYYIGFKNEDFDNQDPDETFIKRFSDITPEVRACSQYQKDARALNKAQNNLGVIFTITSIEYTGADTAEVNGGYYEHPHSASGNTYYLRRKDGKWVVERNKLQWISQNEPRPINTHCVINAACRS